MNPAAFVGLPPALADSVVQTKHFFQALDQFAQVFAIRPGERVLMLTDQLLDTRVVDAVVGLAKARGAQVRVYTEPNSRVTEVPDPVKGLLEQADFVVSTWFCSVLDPFCIAMRKKGQRWVKITYFRNLDLLHTPQARFPHEIVGALCRATAARYPVDAPFDLHFTDARGTDFRIGFTPQTCRAMLSTTRWRGMTSATEPGCYVHYLPTHGPNFWDSTAVDNNPQIQTPMSGVIYPQWAVGFARPFEERIAVHFDGEYVSAVEGTSQQAHILRDMLVGGRMIEGGGCGFNPKAPRHTIYPAGSNAPGALHFGIDLAKPNDYIRRVLPDWEEPPIHMDLVCLDTTVTAGSNTLIDQGFLCALRDPVVIEIAARYGDPVELLEAGVD